MVMASWGETEMGKEKGRWIDKGEIRMEWGQEKINKGGQAVIKHEEEHSVAIGC